MSSNASKSTARSTRATSACAAFAATAAAEEEPFEGEGDDDDSAAFLLTTTPPPHVARIAAAKRANSSETIARMAEGSAVRRMRTLECESGAAKIVVAESIIIISDSDYESMINDAPGSQIGEFGLVGSVNKNR